MPDIDQAEFEVRRDQMRQSIERVWQADVGQRAPLFRPELGTPPRIEGRRGPMPEGAGEFARLTRRYQSHEASPVEVARAALDQAQAEQARLNAFIDLMPEQALAAARQSEERYRRGEPRGPLDGVPIAVKDLIDVAGVRTTAASRILAGNVATEDAPVVEQLKAAGAVIIGKANLHEFAYGGTGDRGCFGPARNPHDPERMAGGSSSGSAVAVAAGICPGALGTDTAGSVRIPAALCGIVGLKPTYGRVSTERVIPLSWSMDHIGPMTATVEDAGLLLAAMCDSFQPPDYSPPAGRPRIGIVRQRYFEGLEPEVRRLVEAALPLLGEVVEVETPSVGLGATAQAVITAAEAVAYHHRWLAEQPEAYDAAVRARLEAGWQIGAQDYVQACRVRRLAAEEMAAAMTGIDAIAAPTVPITAPKFGQTEVVLESGRANLIRTFILNTAPANVSGFPALSLPCGRTAAGLPAGLQLIGKPWQEGALLSIARQLERQLQP